jgi:tRNA 2-thiouridine synthesizing protein A
VSTSPSTSVSTTVDARGQSCPGPLVSLAKALVGAESGDLFELLATDPGSRSDVPSWAEISGNELLETSESPGESPGEFRYLVRKA